MGLIQWFEKNRDISWIIVIGIAMIIFTLSSFGGLGIPSKKGLGIFSITYHFFAFFFLNIFLLIVFVKGERHDFIIIVILISITYGIFDEVHQLFVPGRVNDIFDVMINNAGIFFSTVFYMESMRGERGDG